MLPKDGDARVAGQDADVGEEQNREPEQDWHSGQQATNDVSPHEGSLGVKRRRRPLSLAAKGAATDALV